MKLELNGTELTQTLDDALITSSLYSLRSDDNSFLILSKGSMSYIQTCKAKEGHYILEYQDGSLDKHYECIDDMLTFQKVSMAFIGYLASSDEWKTLLAWQLTDFSANKNSNITRPVKLLGFAIVAALIVFAFLIHSL